MISTVEETGSTNSDLLSQAEEGAPEGSWLRAERQTGGRGRLGRSWHSPAGNLYASTLVRLRPDDPPAPTLALVAAVAVWEMVSPLLPDVRLKWPNDLLLGNAKMCGMLLERSGDAVVIGIGLNCASHPEGLDRPVTSLTAHGVTLAPLDALLRLAPRFSHALRRWRAFGVDDIRESWLEAAHPAGTPLVATLPDGNRIEGQFVTLDPDGGLRLRLADGAEHVIHAGDVFPL